MPQPRMDTIHIGLPARELTGKFQNQIIPGPILVTGAIIRSYIFKNYWRSVIAKTINPSLIFKEGVVDAHGNVHGAAGSGHGGQFVSHTQGGATPTPRDDLMNASHEIGMRTHRGESIPAALKQKFNRAHALVTSLHGANNANRLAVEHKALGKRTAIAQAAATPTAPAAPTAPAISTTVSSQGSGYPTGQPKHLTPLF